MVLVFTEFRNKKISEKEKTYVKDVLSKLGTTGNYYHDLQLLYNNGSHFTTTSHSLCESSKLKALAAIASSKTKILTVIGGIHHNNHVSGVLFDSKGSAVFVEDTYIRVEEDGKFIHILVSPPKLHSPALVTYVRPKGCDFSSTYIPHIV